MIILMGPEFFITDFDNTARTRKKNQINPFDRAKDGRCRLAIFQNACYRSPLCKRPIKMSPSVPIRGNNALENLRGGDGYSVRRQHLRARLARAAVLAAAADRSILW